MTNRLLALVKPFALSLFALAFFALAQGEVRADPVTFTTAGCFGAGCTPGTTATVAFGTASVTFAAAAPAGGSPGQPINVDSTPFVNVDLGTFTISATATPSTLAATPFTLVVTQTVPGPTGTGTFTASLSGTVSNVNGGLVATFAAPTTFVINGITYTLRNLEAGNQLQLDGPATGGVTRIAARIEGSAIPEPMTMLLFGTGLTGIAAAARRRRRKA